MRLLASLIISIIEIISIMSAYAPQTGCGENEKIKCWDEMDEELRDIPDTEKLWVGGKELERHLSVKGNQR